MRAMLVWIIGKRKYERWLEDSAQALLDAVDPDAPQDELLASIRSALRERMEALRIRSQ
jgi:hypothetical protein